MIGASPAAQETASQQGRLRTIKSPVAPYPEEAQRKGVEGKVVVAIAVDGEGKVTEAKALSGPPELVEAAVSSVKSWEFEPPAHAPVETIVEIGYGHPRECPGPVSDSSEVTAAMRFKNDAGTVVDAVDDSDAFLPPYPSNERKAGVSGEMILLVTVGASGKATKVRVARSLSRRLDKNAVRTVRKWKFRLVASSTGNLPATFPVRIQFTSTCSLQF